MENTALNEMQRNTENYICVSFSYQSYDPQFEGHFSIQFPAGQHWGP